MKARHYKPQGFTSVTPYLQVTDASQLLEFMKDAFGATEVDCHRSPDGTIMHADVLIGDAHVEFADATDKWPPTPAALHLYVPNVDETHARAVNAGAASLQEPSDKFYGERSSAVKDPVGNTWYIGTLVEELTPEELSTRMAKIG